MDTKLVKAMNDQIKEELYSAYLYLSMSAYAEAKNLKGFANWFFVQYQEELDHMTGFFRFLNEKGVKIELQAIDQPPTTFKSPAALFSEALKHEQFITAKIHDLFEMARENKDYASETFLTWYVNEQVEEENNATDMVNKIAMIGENGTSIYLLDKELMGRAYKPASILGK